MRCENSSYIFLRCSIFKNSLAESEDSLTLNYTKTEIYYSVFAYNKV